MNPRLPLTALALAALAASGCPSQQPAPTDAEGDEGGDVAVADASADDSTVDSDASDAPSLDDTSLDAPADASDAGDAVADVADALASDAGADSGGGDAGATLRGVLHDDTDRPLGNTMVLACTVVTCFVSTSAADGTFSFPLDPPVDIALKTLENDNVSPRRGAMLYPVQIATPIVVDMGMVYTPALPAGVPIGAASRDPQTLMGGDGLVLTLRRADLTAPLGTDIFDLATRAITPARYPHYDALAGEQVDAVFAVHPFGASSSSPIAVRAPTTLPAGTAVNFRTVSEIDGHLSAAAPGHSDGTTVSTDPGAGITELTWLVISH